MTDPPGRADRSRQPGRSERPDAAVFDTSAQPDLPDVTIVDWKTGRRPDAAGLASRELQLAIYRIAWAKAHGTPLQSVGACFVYLRDGGTLMAGDLDEQQIAARMDELSR